MLEKLPDALGHALRDRRAGLDELAFWRLPLRQGQGALQVSSLAFVDHGPIPALYTADGEGRSPPLAWTGVPPAATSVLLLVEDADSPTPHPLVHAIAADLPTGDGSLPESALNRHAGPDPSGRLGRNSYLRAGWLPPDPPPGHGVHRYAFQVFALAGPTAWSATPGRDEVLRVLAEQAIASGCLIGTYERHDTSVRDGAAETAAVPLAGGPQGGAVA
ncbi:YbhB/YbcL family Raf kinase inhibitor-like protein [Aquabacterium sp. J223]|uniref:YbhB/YbcL family Raf kinase inhibitor-like protein n=1 Tax=Aquabacterium sp. J223 TaxID=2898431 RepID=UPI0021ADE443|nr:YbhB/YbcL family Raf kinase inhibitor-like protein [Aquabacterium sp. J223]UUX94661.1 YbhB/YbcL family Raf kinase inhibitor-like protein [Aquabacterium sp. J223]